MPNGFRILCSRIYGCIARRRMEEDFQQELDLHLQMLTEENLRRGMSPEEARFSAHVQLGGMTQLREVHREMWGFPWLETVGQDVRYGLRQLRRNPGFSLAAIVIAALGIGAACVVFTFADAAVFRALPYQNPSGLAAVSVSGLNDHSGWSGVSAPVYLSWREHAGEIGEVAAVDAPLRSKTLVGGAEPLQVFDKQISGGILSLFGVPPRLGRGFLSSDYDAGGSHAVILSDVLWQQLFQRRSDAIGRTITMDGVGYTIVGIMPPGFLLPGSTMATQPACWTPLILNAKQRSDRKNRSLRVWMRLRTGVSPAEAQAGLKVWASAVLNPTGARESSDWRIQVTPLLRQTVDHWRSTLIFLFGAAAFLLAISCANVANLLLARAGHRRTEIAVRTAIGAGRGRLMRQLLTESLILSGVAGAFGILLAHWGVAWERAALPRLFHTPNFQTMNLDPRVLTATAVVSGVVGIAFGLTPALHATGIDLIESLKEAEASAGPSKKRFDTQRILVTVVVGLSLILSTGAVLMGRSFLNIERVQPGFNPRQVLTMRVLLPGYRYPNRAGRIAAYQELLRKIRHLPGVESSGFVTPLPMTGITATASVPAQPDMKNVPEGGMLEVDLSDVSPGYFTTMGIPLLQGRFFSEQDTGDAEKVAIIGKAFADRYWPGQNPVGKMFYPQYPDTSSAIRIIGEVGDVRDRNLAVEPLPKLYDPFMQHFFAAFAGTLVLRTSKPRATSVAVQKAIRSVDADAPVSQIDTMREILDMSLSDKRLYLIFMGTIAAIALLLAATGIAGTVSYSVSRCKHEVGIRMALGARTSNVLFLVMGRTLQSAFAGIALGVAGSLLLTRLLTSQLYGVRPADPMTLLGVSIFLGLVSILASALPAIRAVSVDPAKTLRAI